MATLQADFTLPLRAFALELALEVSRTVALVGPSGAGKTSVLRVIAGLAEPRARPRRPRRRERGSTPRAGVSIPPERRRVGLVFQDYALFPHLSVRAQRRLRRRRPSRWTRCSSGSGSGTSPPRAPPELSGGERQRVALARALARDPAVLLLDEPLAALDAHTKTEVRHELAELLRELALPTLLVTHDYEDAAALADEVGVLVEGRLRQLGPPAELVARPRDAFVASFTGANLLRGRARRGEGALTAIRLESGEDLYSADEAEGDVGVVVYPWEVSVARTHAPDADSALNVVRGQVGSLVEVANRVRVRVGPVTAEVTAASAARLELAAGGIAYATFKATGTRLVPL